MRRKMGISLIFLAFHLALCSFALEEDCVSSKECEAQKAPAPKHSTCSRCSYNVREETYCYSIYSDGSLISNPCGWGYYDCQAKFASDNRCTRDSWWRKGSGNGTYECSECFAEGKNSRTHCYSVYSKGVRQGRGFLCDADKEACETRKNSDSRCEGQRRG